MSHFLSILLLLISYYVIIRSYVVWVDIQGIRIWENQGQLCLNSGGTTTQKDPAKAGSFILRAIIRKLAFKIEAIKMKANPLGFFLDAKDRTIGITEFR